jgi:hypothetical protein
MGLLVSRVGIASPVKVRPDLGVDPLNWPLSLGLEVQGSKPKSSEEDWEPSSPVCFSRLLR